jgi:hypothetical protein
MMHWLDSLVTFWLIQLVKSWSSSLGYADFPSGDLICPCCSEPKRTEQKDEAEKWKKVMEKASVDHVANGK